MMAITRATGMDRETLRKYLRLAYKKGFTKEAFCDLDELSREVVNEVQSYRASPERSLEQILLPHRGVLRRG